MNSVANNTVATLMNSQIGVNQGVSIKAAVSNDTFKNLLNKSKSYQSLDEKAFKALSEEKRSQSNVGHVEETKEASTTLSVTTKKENSDEVVEEQPQELTEKALSDVTEESLETMESTMMQFISDLLDVDEKELETMMADMGITPIDLMDMSKITELVVEVFEVDDLGQLLLLEDASTAIKEIDTKLQSMLQDAAKELGMEVESLEAMIKSGLTTEQTQTIEAEMKPESQTQSTVEASTTVEGSETEGLKLEVVDERAGGDATKYSQDSKGEEEQSFSGLLSSNTEMTKEVVVVNNGDQLVYKEVSANEVINQIVTKAVVTLSDAKTTMELQLNPGNLGKIGVQITAEQGIVKGQFVAENQVVKEMIETNMAQLKTQLEAQGIKVDKIEVTLGNSNQFFEGQKEKQHQSDQDKANKRRVERLSRMRQISEVVDFLNEEVESDKSLGNVMMEHSVEYSA